MYIKDKLYPFITRKEKVTYLEKNCIGVPYPLTN